MGISQRRIDNYNDFLNTLHCDEREVEVTNSDICYITVAQKKCGKWSQYHYRKKELLENVTDILNSNKNTYISVNSFYIPIRKAENVRRINSIYMEFDNHLGIDSNGNKITNFHFNALLFFLKEDYFGSKVPYPTIIVNSGRGIHLYWKLKDLPKKLIPYWSIVRDCIINELKDVKIHSFELDPASTDVARVMRIAGTKNLKANKLCNLAEINENSYTLDEIVEGYFPQLLERKHKKDKNKSKAKIEYLKTIRSLHFARLQDIVKLVEIRQGYSTVDGKVDGNRELLCFLYRYWSCCYSSDTDKAIEDTLDFNQKFKVPLSVAEVIKATRSAEVAYEKWEKAFNSKEAEAKINVVTKNETTKVYKFAGYNYKTETLIKILKITIKEQQYMQNLISKEIKNERNKKAKREKRRNVNGLTTREQQKEDTIMVIKELKILGYSQRKVSTESGYSIATVKKYWNI